MNCSEIWRDLARSGINIWWWSWHIWRFNLRKHCSSITFFTLYVHYSFFCVHVVSNIYCTYHDMIRHGNHLESPEFPICNNYTCIRIQYRLWGNKFKCNSDSLHLILKWIFLFFNFSPLNMYYWKNNDKLSITR